MKPIRLFPVVFTAICAAAVTLYAAAEPKNMKKTAIVTQAATLPHRLSLAPTTKHTSVATEHAASTPNLINRPKSTITEPATGMELMAVPGGCYQMGDNGGDADEKPVHQVCLDSFYIGKHEVTQGQWLQIMGTTPAFFSFCGNDCPVENVSWNDVQEFISKLNRLNSGGYRLMTEAEWEYACRSGGKSERFCGGDDVGAVAWYDRNSSSKPHQGGEQQSNGLGLFDMSGNVWEWVSDLYQNDYYATTQGRNPVGALTGPKRVMRGGSWYNDHKNVRASIRGSLEPGYRSINLGFRMAYSIR